MNLYRWDTDIGVVLAYALTVALAREQVMSTLSSNDQARDDLAEAIKGEPEVMTGPTAVVAWHR